MTAARQRLKSNLGALALLTFARNLFTPYLYLRGQIIRAVDWFSTSSRTHRGIDVVWYIETAMTLVLLYNVAEAAYHSQYPSTVPDTPAGPKLVPVLKSSPLTRSYPPTADLSAGAAAYSTPTRNATQSPLSQSLYRPMTPTRIPTTPDRHPLASSTRSNSTPSQTGLFYDDSSAASPLKAALGPGAPASPQKSTRAPAAPSLDREEREWVDNVWKGVIGKGRKVGL